MEYPWLFGPFVVQGPVSLAGGSVGWRHSGNDWEWLRKGWAVGLAGEPARDLLLGLTAPVSAGALELPTSSPPQLGTCLVLILEMTCF